MPAAVAPSSSVSSAAAATESSVAEPAKSPVTGYEFITNPAKKAFFEESSQHSDSRNQTAMYNRSDVDINMEASINQYVLHKISDISCFKHA